jgi:hypothetical protein
MSNTTRTIKVSSEDCQKLARLGALENSFNSLIERLLWIYYDREKKTTTATGNRRAGTGKPQELGGIPHELGTTGYGVAVALDSAMEALDKTRASPTRSAILDKRSAKVSPYERLQGGSHQRYLWHDI